MSTAIVRPNKPSVYDTGERILSLIDSELTPDLTPERAELIVDLTQAYKNLADTWRIS